MNETFFTTVGCMDGRVESVVAEYGRSKFGAIFPDTITEAGLVGLLASDTPDQSLLGSLNQKLLISLNKHHSRGIVVHGHQECAGNPVPDEVHRDHVRQAVSAVESLIDHAVPVVGVFVVRNGDGWTYEMVPPKLLAQNQSAFSSITNNV